MERGKEEERKTERWKEEKRKREREREREGGGGEREVTVLNPLNPSRIALPKGKHIVSIALLPGAFII